jgi:hypothetical protein
MSELRQKLEAWASVANNRAFAFSDAEFGALAMLDLLWPVIEAAKAHSCQMGEAALDEALAALERALKERG